VIKTRDVDEAAAELLFALQAQTVKPVLLGVEQLLPVSELAAAFPAEAEAIRRAEARVRRRSASA
jgi:hypothetical protein